MNADTRSTAARPIHAGSENCLPIGTRLSDFEITGVLGEGGFGIVYVAYDHALQRTVAIKEYMPGVLAMRAADAADAGIALRSERHQETFRLGLKSFINEARILAQFDHPALVKVYRFWEQNNTAYTAMKFYDGRTMKDIVANSPELVDEAWCRRVTGQILGALEMLYTMRILHRDISPDNIMVQDNGDAVLLDFGSARQIIGDAAQGLTVILKPGYAPVEQYTGDASLEQGAYTDLYALSAVMYFAITKTPPPSSIGRMIKDPMVALTAQAPAGYSEQLLAAIDKGLAVMARDRPQTIDAFRALLGLASPAPAPAPAPLIELRALPPVPAAPVPVAAAEPAPEVPEAPAVTPEPAAAPARPAIVASKRRRILVGAGGAGLLAAAAGLYAIVESSTRETFALAQPQSRPAAAAPRLPDTTTPAAQPAPAAHEAGEPSRTGSTAGVASLKLVGNDRTANAAPVASAAPVPALPAVDAAPAPAQDTPAAVAPKADAKRPAAPVSASYKLRIKPWGTLYVDGKPAGVSPPLKQIVLTPGKHAIRVVNPGFPEYVTTIQVGKTRSGAIVHDFVKP